MNITSYVSEAASQFTQTPISAYPGILWSWYILYLWNYEPDSWVARIANVCRVLSILLCLPTLILGLVDVSAYVIARTLGVVDDVKASTSDKMTVTQVQAPIIRIERPHDTDSSEKSSSRSSLLQREQDDSIAPEHPKEFFAEDNNLKLSGVDILSPAATRPPSPVITRRNLVEPENTTLRQRQQHQP